MTKCVRCQGEYPSPLALKAHAQEAHAREGYRALRLYTATWAEGVDLLDIQRHPGRRGHSHHHARAVVCGERKTLEVCSSGRNLWNEGVGGIRVACKQVLRLVDFEAEVKTIEVYFMSSRWGMELWAREHTSVNWSVYPWAWSLARSGHQRGVVTSDEDMSGEPNEGKAFFVRKWDKDGLSKSIGECHFNQCLLILLLLMLT